MKLSVFRESFTGPGVALLERDNVEVSLERVVREGLGSLEPLRAPGVVGVHFEAGWHPGQEPERRDEAFVFRAPDGSVRKVRGLVCADSGERLANFVLEHCEVEGQSPFAQLLSRARDKKGLQARRLFAREIGQADEQASGPFYGSPSGRRGHNGPLSDPRFPFLTRHELQRSYTPLALDESAPVRVPRAGPGTLVACPTIRRVSGRAVPRLALVIPFLGPDGSGALVFDGDSFRGVRSLGEIPAALARAFEEHGFVASRAEFDVLPSPHLRARVLVRVPPASELAKTRASRRRPRVPLLESPAFVLDSRVPVRLGGAEPVLDHPALARAVLARTSSGIYLPREVPGRDQPRERLPEEESWLVLADVGALRP